MNFKEFYLKEVKANDFIVIYPGRFQPFTSGHKKSYDSLVTKFGKDKVFIVTSNKVELPDSPFNYVEKKEIITKMFDIPEDKIIQVKNPYIAIELTSKFPENTAVIFAVGNKDAERLRVDTGKYFESYQNDKDMVGYRDHGYVYILSETESTIDYKGKPISGTRFREIFAGSDEKEKKELFDAMYGKFNKYIYELLSKKIGV